MQLGWPSRGEYHHLVLAQETRLLLEMRLAAQGGVLLQWRSERLRHLSPPQTNPQDIPDAQVEWRAASSSLVEVVDIEIDGQYFGQMLAQKAAHYGDHPGRVLWACSSDRAALVGAAIHPYPNIELLILPALAAPNV